jgi:hypothetical protein
VTDMAGAALKPRAAAVTALASLSKLSSASVAGVMLVSNDGAEAPEVSQLVPTDRAIQAMSGVIQSAVKTYTDCEVIDYEPAGLTAGKQVMWIELGDVPLLKAIVDDAADLADMPMFDPRKSSLSDVELAAMRAEADGVEAVFLQSLRGSQIVAQSTRIGVIIRRGVIDLPPRGQLVLFTRNVAVVIVGAIAFFRDRATFQRLSGFLEELQQQAGATFQAVTTNLRIAGFDLMAQVVTGSPAMVGKMASIQRKLDRYPEYRAALTMPNLVAFITTHPECGVEIVGSGDTAELAFRNDPQHRFKILKLLDDDYLRSELTTLEYEANSKSAPIG